jgi:hypothetical protein
LQVLQNGHRCIEFRRDGAQVRDVPGVFFVAAVRKIEARDIHPGLDEPTDRFRRAARWAESCDNFGAAHRVNFIPSRYRSHPP